MIRHANDGNVILSDIPEIPVEISERLRPYQNVRSAAFIDWTADGKALYIATRFADLPQLHRVDRPGGMRRQLSFDTEPIRGAWRRPHSDEVLYARDIGGGEFYQLFLFDPATGRSRMLTDGKSRNESPSWSRDGKRLAFTSTRRDGRSNDVWMMDPESDAEPTLIVEASDGSAFWVADWDAAGERVLVQQYVSITDSRIHLVDVGSGDRRQILGGHPVGAFSPIAFDASDERFFLSTDIEGEFQQLAIANLSDGGIELLSADIDWNVESAATSEDRERLAFTVNANGSSELYLVTEDLEVQQLDIMPRGIISGLHFSPDGDHLGMSFDSGTAPSEAYTLHIGDDDHAGNAPVRWTFSEIGGLNPDTFVGEEVIHYPSFDGRKIPAFLYKPAGNGPYPVIINIHGGPEGQVRPGFSGVIQSWIGEVGAAVLNPNVRGSDGYGKSYLKLDNGKLREDSVKDIGALIDWIETRADLDSDRVMVYGGSYGGYMVLASLIHFGDRLRAGIDIVGISDFITFLENTQDYRRDLRRVEYGDERDPDMRAFFEKISPLRNAAKIRTPLFVIQGQNDPRVPVSEAEQIVEQVRANGRDVWYMNALNEGHGYARKENQDLMRDAVILFMKTHL